MSAEGDEIRQERKSLGLTQKQLAAATGVGLRSITRIETGEAERDGRDVDGRSLVVLQRYLRVGPYKPAAGTDDPPLSAATPAELLAAVSRSRVTFAELLGALAEKHGQEVRRSAREAVSGAARPAGPKDRDEPLVTPRYDGSEFDDEQEADRANRPGAAG